MPRFAEIEGLRAWLAWTVVLGHVFVVLGFQGFRIGEFAPLAGADAVEIFVLISGFVIAGLVIDQQERWTAFITRRAFRIFPAYLIALAVGAVGTPLAIIGLDKSGWGVGSWFHGSMVGGLASTNQWPWEHWALHLTLLQGAVPSSILPWSAVAFVGPAWSLSLEWQFYLLAPALVWAMRSPKWAPWLVLAAFVLSFLFQKGVFGAYETYTSLIGGLWLFVIGIATRLALPALKQVNLSVAPILLGAIGVMLMSHDLFSFAVWVAFVAILVRPEPRTLLDRTISGGARALLASPLATALGARSYSVYIIHIPIMKILIYLLPLQAMSSTQALFALAATAIPLTLVVSEVMYRFVERTMIRTGAKLAKSMSNARPSKNVAAATTSA